MSEKALSIKNPWGILIALGIKDIENRTWKTNYRGKVLIHCSSTFDPRHKSGLNMFTPEQQDIIKKAKEIGDMKDLLTSKGCIIGEFNLVDCVQEHPSVWAEVAPPNWPKPIWNWVIEDAVLYDKPIENVVGSLNLWNYKK